MCTQCVAQAMPYLGVAVGGLKAMTWNAKRARLKGEAQAAPADESEPEHADHGHCGTETVDIR